MRVAGVLRKRDSPEVRSNYFSCSPVRKSSLGRGWLVGWLIGLIKRFHIKGGGGRRKRNSPTASTCHTECSKKRSEPNLFFVCFSTDYVLASKCTSDQYYDTVVHSCAPCSELCDSFHVTNTRDDCLRQCPGSLVFTPC